MAINKKRSETVKVGEVEFTVTEQPMAVSAPILDLMHQGLRPSTAEWLPVIAKAVSNGSGEPLGDEAYQLSAYEYLELSGTVQRLHLPPEGSIHDDDDAPEDAAPGEAAGSGS